MLKLIGLIDKPPVYADGMVLYKHMKGFVIAYQRTKRTMVRHLPDTMRRAERRAQWGGRLSLHTRGTIHLK